MRLLWVDDDSGDDRVLSGLLLFFENTNLNVSRALSYEEGLKRYRELVETEGPGSHAVLVDAVLPLRMGKAGIAWDLGMRFIRHVAAGGVRKIAVLSVVERREIADAIAEIENAHQVTIHYTPKANLFSGAEIEHLIAFLLEPVQKGQI